jgi:hypothetical protein
MVHPMRFLSRAIVLCLVCCAVQTSAEPIRFAEPFKIPAEEVIWAAINQPAAREMELAWQPIDPRKDPSRPDDFWRHWPTPFSPFYAGVKLPAEAFTLAALYPKGSLVYPHATYDGKSRLRDVLRPARIARMALRLRFTGQPVLQESRSPPAGAATRAGAPRWHDAGGARRQHHRWMDHPVRQLRRLERPHAATARSD